MHLGITRCLNLDQCVTSGNVWDNSEVSLKRINFACFPSLCFWLPGIEEYSLEFQNPGTHRGLAKGSHMPGCQNTSLGIPWSNPETLNHSSPDLICVVIDKLWYILSDSYFMIFMQLNLIIIDRLFLTLKAYSYFESCRPLPRDL